MSFNYSPKIVNDSSLVLYLDAANNKSYVSGSTTWNDISRGGNNGILTNSPSFNTSFNGRITFDGVDDYVNCGNILTTQTNTQTISFVITVPQPQVISSGFYIGTVFGRYGTSDFFRDYSIAIWNTGNIASPSTYDIYFQTLNQAGSVATTFTLGTYAFSSTPRSFTFSENAGVCSGYTNGIYVNQALITHYTPSANTEIDIGFTNNSAKYLYFKGTINQLSYYNRALSAAEILQNYNATKTRFGL